MGYVSLGCLSTIADTYNKLIMEGADELDVPETARDILQSWLRMEATQATAFVVSNLPEGIAYIDRSPESRLSILSGPVTIAIVVRLAMYAPLLAKSPLAKSHLADQQEEEPINGNGQLEKLLSSLTLYARDHDGTYPAKLENLFPKYLHDKSLLLSDAGPIHYEAGLTDKDQITSIILYIKAQPHKTVLVAFLHGLVEPMPRWAFDTQLALQRDRKLDKYGRRPKHTLTR